MNTPNKGQTPSRPQKLSSILTQGDNEAPDFGVTMVRMVRPGVRLDRFSRDQHQSPNSNPLPNATCRLWGVCPGVDVANRIGHTRRPVLHKVSFCGTRPQKAAQGGVLPLLCGSINVLYEYNPVGSSSRDVPFLTGQKGDGKSRRAGRAAADGSALRRGHESVDRFAMCPSAAQSRPRRHTAKGPEKRIGARRRGKLAGVTALILFYCKKRVDRERISTRDSDLPILPVHSRMTITATEPRAARPEPGLAE
jgi:hypothetical protein